MLIRDAISYNNQWTQLIDRINLLIQREISHALVRSTANVIVPEWGAWTIAAYMLFP